MVEPVYELDSLLADLDSPTTGWSWDKQSPDPVAKAKDNVQMVDGAKKHQFSAVCAEDSQTKPPPSRTPEAVDSAPAPLTRRDRVERYIAKRCRRKFDKVVRYQCRKVYADARPRIKGRFVKPEELEAYYRGTGAGKGST